MKLDFFIRSFGWLMLCMISFTHAQQYDHNYLKWKETQQAQDEKLKLQGKVPTSPNHYLSAGSGGKTGCNDQSGKN